MADDQNTDDQDLQDDPNGSDNNQQTPENKPPEIDWKARSREWEAKAKKSAGAERKLQELAERDMSDLQKAQKAAADANERANAVTAKATARATKATFNAMASARNSEFDTSDVLDLLDLSRFADEDGDIDEKGLQAIVNRLIPAGGSNPSFEGGARKSAPQGPDINQMIRDIAGRGQ
jgi:hypothetical protein